MAKQRLDNRAVSTLKPVVVLVAICMVAGVLLGAVYSATAPVAAAVALERQQQTYRELLPAAASFEDMPYDLEGCTALVRALDEQGQQIGGIAIAQTKGYSGQVPLAVAFDETGAVVGVVVMSNSETPGLGTRIAEEEFTGQLLGRLASSPDLDSVDTISGATISSKAALGAFGLAAQVWEETVLEKQGSASQPQDSALQKEVS